MHTNINNITIHDKEVMDCDEPCKLCEFSIAANTNEDMINALSDVSLGVYLYTAQIENNLLSPVQWTEWLRKEVKKDM
jgi:hypothetical protein